MQLCNKDGEEKSLAHGCRISSIIKSTWDLVVRIMANGK